MSTQGIESNRPKEPQYYGARSRSIPSLEQKAPASAKAEREAGEQRTPLSVTVSGAAAPTQISTANTRKHENISMDNPIRKIVAIESEITGGQKAERTLALINKIIGAVISKINDLDRMGIYSHREISILKTIYRVIREDFGIKYRPQHLMTDGLGGDELILDCDTGCFVYYAVLFELRKAGHLRDVTVDMAIKPHHASIILHRIETHWGVDEMIHFETTSGKLISRVDSSEDESYRLLEYRIHDHYEPTRSYFDPLYAIIYMNRSTVYVKQNMLDRALIELSKAIKLNGRLYHAYIVRANIYLRQKRYEAVISDCSVALGIRDNADCHYMRGISYNRLAMYRSAVRDLERITAKDESERMFELGIAYNGIGEHEKAVESLDKAISLRRNFADANIERALAHVELGKFDLAKADLLKAYAIDPKNAQLYCHRGYMYFKLGRNEEAMKDYRAAIRLDRTNSRSYLYIGLLHARNKEHGPALLNFNKAIEISPHYAAAYGARAELYCELGRYDLALKDAIRMVKEDPEDIYGHELRGRLYRHFGEYSLAFSDYMAAKKLRRSMQQR